MVQWLRYELLTITELCIFSSQIALQFPYRFWDSKIQGADFFGHIPPDSGKRGLFGVFYDMDPQVPTVYSACLRNLCFL